MNLRALVETWLHDRYPDVRLEKDTIVVPIDKFFRPKEGGDIWYAGTIWDSHIKLYNPLAERYGQRLDARHPKFFDILTEVISFYKQNAS